MQTLKNVVLAILNMLIRLSIACLVVVYVYRFAMASYHFGYMVFTDGPKDLAPGRDITVSIELDDSAYDVGKTLQNRGVIEDAKLFFVQEYLSEYHKQLKPGTYTLNTSMKPSEIIETMAADPNQTEEDAKEDEDTLMDSSQYEPSDEVEQYEEGSEETEEATEEVQE